MRLMPKLIADEVKAGRFERLKELNIVDCFECGACAYACPSYIPLVKYIKEGKEKCKR